MSFLEESGVATQMTRTYARASCGVRIHEATPQGHWKILTTEEATDTDIFLAYLDHVLCPKLKPGDVVVMDNLSAHKVERVLRA